MNEQEQRVEIAEACGIQTIAYTFYYQSHGGKEQWHIEDTKEKAESYRDLMIGDPVIEVPHPRLPDYTRSLDAAMAAARHFKDHVLDADDWRHFGEWIETKHPTAALHHASSPIDYFDFATLMVDTGADTICECLLRAANKWKEVA